MSKRDRTAGSKHGRRDVRGRLVVSTKLRAEILRASRRDGAVHQAGERRATRSFEIVVAGVTQQVAHFEEGGHALQEQTALIRR